MANDHYFSATPESELRPRQVHVTLAGQPLTLSTAAGVFSPDGVDRGTKVLLGSVPAPAADGALLDIGCGWGPIAITMALQSPEAQVWGVDVNERVLGLARANAAAAGASNVTIALPDDVPADLRFRTIWSNPPIRVGKDELHQILLTWLPRLEVGGDAWLVVSKDLGGDSLQKWLVGALGSGFAVTRESTAKGFRVIRVQRSA
ncbi:class I SAM-dependent methyltransferase [Curtobacterium flaccumfaciens]|uniref:class I SAM-dependent methyltransferase n=1 Tax=Curtobacterium flaccumfaciens TaxID=2035 RepID=UPI000FFE3E24|nr:methyltransferase [Curtobacterium flaccumfaciens]MCS0644312.1 methyltransferase [Curtobacterium flaccumfaciens pv. flaccumfaciens]MCS6527038.1 methyltransferase [Curtobacterium flaccumfaciens pv. flaccumfaciens]MCS6528822.1 methyltransferase [Curtobacterium flaccumfaciens pv. flaccumfaciens]NUU09052.1 methyltransferase [Curtobacterium flaccumfaciens]RXF83519.1 MFS transporter [Curtobacterium flaccumfaciens pv. flaccumfaciens]